MAARISSRCRPRTALQRSAPSDCASAVEPSMSVKTKATVPVGSERAVGASSVALASVLARLGALSEARRQPTQDCEADRRVVEDEPFELPAGERQAAGRLGGDDLGDPRQPVDHRHLPAEVAGAQKGDLAAVADHPNGALDDHEEPGPDLALPGDDVVRRERHLDRPIADRREVVAGDADEQRAAADERGPLVEGDGHETSGEGVRRDAARPRRPASNATCAPGTGQSGALRGSAGWQNSIDGARWRDSASMASSDEIVDQIAGFALFADLTTPQLDRIAHMFEEEVHPEGTRVLRQGITGSAFHVILEGEAAVIIDGHQRAV